VTAVLAAIGVTVVCAILAPAVFTATSPHSYFDGPGSFRKLFRAARGPALVHGILALVVAAIVVAAEAPVWAVVAIPLVPCVALIVVSLRIARPLRDVHRWGRMLENEKTRADGRQKLLAFAEHVRQLPGDDATRGSFTIAIATTLSNGQLYADAATVVDGCPEDGLSDHEVELLALARLSSRVNTGDAVRGRQALASVPVLEDGTIHFFVRRNLEARLLVIENEPRAALALLGEPAPNPIVECGRLVSRAHAFAALGEMAELEETFEDIERDHGEQGMRRVLEPEGPASARARTRLRGDGSAFR
jgi:hypothetical protein